jgi:hypothetical protein
MSDELLKNEGEGEEVEGHKSHPRMRGDSAPSEDADLGDEVEAHKSHPRMRGDSAPSEDADLGDEVEAHKQVRDDSDDSDFELHRHKA